MNGEKEKVVDSGKVNCDMTTDYDPQEEEYARLADSEGDKFDSRLFWFAGGVGALSLGYFQAVGLLRNDWVLVAGYVCLILGIVCLLISLLFTSYLYGELSVLFRRKNQSALDDRVKIQIEIKKYEPIISKGVFAFNIISMFLVVAGTIFLVVFMFLNA